MVKLAVRFFFWHCYVASCCENGVETRFRYLWSEVEGLQLRNSSLSTIIYSMHHMIGEAYFTFGISKLKV